MRGVGVAAIASGVLSHVPMQGSEGGSLGAADGQARSIPFRPKKKRGMLEGLERNARGEEGACMQGLSRSDGGTAKEGGSSQASGRWR